MLVKNLIFIVGISRAGKFLLGKVLDGFKETEHFQYVGLLEHLPFLERIGLISRDTAVALLQVSVDENAYHMRIGRNLNFRYDDHSSLGKSYFRDMYLKRSLQNIGPHIIRAMKKDKKYSVFVGHELMSNVKICFEAFPYLKIINLLRHPVDLIHSLWLRGFGKRETIDPLFFQPFIRVSDHAVPWYAYQWGREYQKISAIDRLIKMMKTLDETSRESYALLTNPEKKRILFITYEDLVQDSWKVIRHIEGSFGLTRSRFMPALLKREKCLRKIPAEERNRKIKDIRRKASRKAFDLMMDLSERYEHFTQKGELERLYLCD